ncbi:hypothetical protein A5821_002210 [Enterococcus sp. 7F3_DIV0205]|uniref:Gram-positive cocci surface proteins LPxTG domain-containing protein n=1 Tax=Candidatus Enterococcus palustris TaxID=1834189 RepID=A0AAQ3WA56_9ENTE|nr:MucBP domain-containing protein [Enterococcus sp. 7F3_DIV0205]OTN82649.1 hypothetical protein A5821_002560 [Enterococcus sp. 7F3_DIV0205]
MKKTIISLFTLVMALFLVPLSSEAAQINFYDIDYLSPQEQAAIIKEKPSVSGKYEQYNLIYQKISAAATPNDNSNSGLSIGSKNDGMTAKPSSQSQLPKAGEFEHSNLLLYGSGFIVASLFIFYKRRKYSKLLLIIMIPAAISSSSMIALAAGEPLLPKENISISKDETKIIEPTLIEGYEYVGYYPDAEVVPPATESTVTVRYIDENSEEIHEAKTIHGTVGEGYDVSTEQFKLPIANYSLNENNLPNNSVGTFTKEAQTVTYEYQKEVVPEKGKVMIYYLDKNGVEIQPADTLSGEVDQPFHVEQKEISGYILEHTSGELDGVFSAEDQVVQLYYTDEAKINIHYIDKTSKQPLALNSLPFYAPYLKPDISDIDDYYYTSSYNGKTYEQGAIVPSDQLIVKVGTVYTLPKEIRFLITKPTGETMDYFFFPKPISPPGGGLIIEIDSYSNFLYFNEKPEYIPVNYTGTADQLEIDVTYEISYIGTAIPEP